MVNSISASWDGEELAICNGDSGSISRFDNIEIVGGVPELPLSDAVADRFYWPLESLLVRSFELPLGDPKFLDESIVGQEVLESAGVRLDEWWLSWQAGKAGEGIAGLVFGLPTSIQQEMQAHSVWQSCPALVIDGLERLAAMRERSNSPESAAIFDADKQGIFFGYCRGGTWRGIRRLNWQQVDSSVDDRAQQIIRSLSAMGFNAAEEPVYGTIDMQMVSALQDVIAHWHVDGLEILPDRNEATLALSSTTTELNFRRGRWALRDWSSLSLWRRPLLIAVIVASVWGLVTVSETLMLQSQARQFEAQISGTFKAAVPGGPDVGPDYQMELLRKNAGVTDSSENASRFLPELNALAKAWPQQSWQVQEIDFRKDRMQVSGRVKTVDDLEKVKGRLQEALQKSVIIDDTKLADDSVSFRMHW